MKVDILKPSSYCAGVNNAINIALRAKKENPSKDIYILGALVHNEFVTKMLLEKGIKTLLGNKEEHLNDLPDESIVVFTAHGHSPRLTKIAENKNMVIYDATCPKVLSNLMLIVNEAYCNHQVIYIGQPDHPETIAAIETSEKVLLYDSNNYFDYSKVTDKDPLILNQTTLNILTLKDIHNEILSKIPKARILDEICSTTRKRQEAVQNIDATVDLIVVIGDNSSNNSKKLLEIAKKSHPEVESIFISSKDDLEKLNLNNKKHIAISSGASTPSEVIDDVYNYLISL